MYPIWPHNSPTGFLQPGSMLRRSRFWEYSRLVRSTYRANLVRYWPLVDTSGTTAVDLSNNRGSATYSGVTPKQDGMGDGHQCPLFASSFVNCYSAAFNTAFPRAAGTIALWAKVLNAGVWTDGSARYIFLFTIDANNTSYLRRSTTNNQLQTVRIAQGNPAEIIVSTAYALTTWLHLAVTWDSVIDEFKFYINSNLIATNTTIGGALVGNLGSTTAGFGAQNTGLGQPWSGYLAHAAIWNVALPAQTVKRLYRG